MQQRQRVEKWKIEQVEKSELDVGSVTEHGNMHKYIMQSDINIKWR